ncbi:hypothetical protein HH310_22425 [Actinoplanes sp. TBRC 11911]|uniref:sensor histidine kinase n=1 Tax=Actinoplanes sp. TBRC 11911 TaxID=2729386 RepID=UPI00145E5AFF|nr:ATP-binding protein [Actinoplanes sp. TBRC 11911]NMO53924.1 hypothetical protein [Actinoplanes sp. TBRC 11911]
MGKVTAAGPVVGGVGGALILAVAMSPSGGSAATPPFLGGMSYGAHYGGGWVPLVVPIAATAIGLCLLRFWPYLLAAAALLSIAPILAEWPFSASQPPYSLVMAGTYARVMFALIGLLACAQGLVRRGSPGWGSAVAGLAVGGAVVGTGLLGASWQDGGHGLKPIHLVLIAAGFMCQIPMLRRRPPRAEPVAGSWWQRVRLPLTGTLAVASTVPLGFLTVDRLGVLLGVGFSPLYRHPLAVEGVLGAILLTIVFVLAVVSGLWSLGGALTAAIVQVAVVAPLLLAVTAMSFDRPVRWIAALVGVGIGAAAAASRWRVPAAVALAVGGAVALLIAYAATGAHPEKLADQHQVVPGVLILIVIAAAGTAVTGATAPILAPRGALPAALGPLATMLSAGGTAAVAVTYLNSDGEPVSSYLNPVLHLNTSALLLLVAAGAIGGLGLGQVFAARRAERLRTEQIRQEAAAAERDRLARPIHDGVLQVLALVQRHGSELGGPGPELAELAGRQEVALRNLLRGRSTAGGNAREDLRTELVALGSPAIDVAAPAQPVMLPTRTATELTAAVQAALDNVRRHAGAGAHVWILLEEESDGVRVTVRDDGVGFGPDRLAEAAVGGRLGVAQSMKGRIADLGGITTIHSAPGEGTEVEFWVPAADRAGY